MSPADILPHTFCVYVMEGYQSCHLALENLTGLCERYLLGRYSIEIIDITANPEVAVRENILAIPTIVRTQPLPPLKIVGDLTDIKICARLLGMSDQA